MIEDIISLISYKMPSFSKGQKRIANLILESKEKVAFWTASRVGRETDVSESTVVRFASELGFSGYPQMQQALQELVMNQLTSAEVLDLSEDSQDMVSNVMHSETKMLMKTAESLDRVAFNQAVNHICSAEKVYILADSSYCSMDEYMACEFRLLLPYVQVIMADEFRGILRQFIHLSSDDAVVAFGFPHYSPAIIPACEYAKKHAASVISFAYSMLSPVVDVSSCALIVKCEEDDLGGIPTVPFSVIHALYKAVADKKNNVLQNNLKKLAFYDKEHYDCKIEDK